MGCVHLCCVAPLILGTYRKINCQSFARKRFVDYFGPISLWTHTPLNMFPLSYPDHCSCGGSCPVLSWAVDSSSNFNPESASVGNLSLGLFDTPPSWL